MSDTNERKPGIVERVDALDAKLTKQIATQAAKDAAQDAAIAGVANMVSENATTQAAKDAAQDAAIAGKFDKSGDTMTGPIETKNWLGMRRDTDSSQLNIFGGYNSNRCAQVVLYGADHSDLPGVAALSARNGTNTAYLYLFPNGTATLSGRTVLTLTASWDDGNGNGYLKFNNGLIIQWGIGEVGAAKLITLHTPFKNNKYYATAMGYGGYAWSDNVSSATLDYTTTSFKAVTNQGTACKWFACGY